MAVQRRGSASCSGFAPRRMSSRTSAGVPKAETRWRSRGNDSCDHIFQLIDAAQRGGSAAPVHPASSMPVSSLLSLAQDTYMVIISSHIRRRSCWVSGVASWRSNACLSLTAHRAACLSLPYPSTRLRSDSMDLKRASTCPSCSPNAWYIIALCRLACP